MLSDARAYFFMAPHILLGSALFIILTVFSPSLIGEGLGDMLDPYERVGIQHYHDTREPRIIRQDNVRATVLFLL